MVVLFRAPDDPLLRLVAARRELTFLLASPSGAAPRHWPARLRRG